MKPPPRPPPAKPPPPAAPPAKPANPPEEPPACAPPANLNPPGGIWKGSPFLAAPASPPSRGFAPKLNATPAKGLAAGFAAGLPCRPPPPPPPREGGSSRAPAPPGAAPAPSLPGEAVGLGAPWAPSGAGSTASLAARIARAAANGLPFEGSSDGAMALRRLAR